MKKVIFIFILLISLMTSNVYANNMPYENPDIVLLSNNPKTIYLTFDDGPSKNTYKILDILDKYNVKATFFVLGKGAEYLPDTVKDIVNRGHAIGSHGYSHEYKNIYKNEDAFTYDLVKGIEIIKNITGEEVKLYRFPGGSNNAYMKNDFYNNITNKLKNEYGIACFDWNVTSGDANVDTTFQTMRASVFHGINTMNVPVVLFHDLYKPHTIDLCEQIIVEGLVKGYTFSVLDKNMPSITLNKK